MATFWNVNLLEIMFLGESTWHLDNFCKEKSMINLFDLHNT